jgi:microcystin-dependent protein
MSDFRDAVRHLLPQSWAMRDGFGWAFGHIAAADLPECNERRGNEHRYIRGGAGVADRTVVCEKNAAEAWAWKDKGDAYLAANHPPTGTVGAFAGVTTPNGWLLCDGSSVSRTTYAALWAALSATKGTVTVTLASPGVFTRTGHGLVLDDAVYLTTTGALPTGLTASTTYYVVSVPTADTFTVAATRGGAAITTSGSQSGPHTLVYAPHGIPAASTTNFLLPDYRGRALVGRDTTQTEFNALGELGGVKTVTLTAAQSGVPAHTHPLTHSGHSHNTVDRQNVGANTAGPAQGSSNDTQANTAANAAEAHSNLQPYAVANWIIRE